jgi:hypothetical protein
VVQFTSSSAITATVPTGLGIGCNIIVEQAGTGTVSFSFSGTTPHQSSGSASTARQWAKALLYSDTDTVWQLSGDLTGYSNVFTQTGTGAVVTTVDAVLKRAINVKDFGAKGDGQVVQDAGITSGLQVLTSSSATFSPNDCNSGGGCTGPVNKLFDINGAGTASCGQQYYGITAVNMNCNLVGTVTGYTDAHTVTVSVAAGHTVTGAQLKWCTDDTTSVHSAFAALTAAGGPGTLHFSSGNYCVSAKSQHTFVGKTVEGDGMWQSNIWQIGPVAYTSATYYSAVVIDNGSSGVTFRNIGFEGTNAKGELGSDGMYQSDGLFVCSGVPNDYSSYCNSNSGITDITVSNSRFDHQWGEGFHVPGTGTSVGQQVNNVTVLNSLAQYNGWDGFNPGIYDRLTFVGNTALYNGVAGAEIANYGSANVTGNTASWNRNVGLAVGGLGSAATGSSAVITGNIANHNGNGSTVNTMGVGISVATYQDSVTVSGNTTKQNHYIGIFVESTGLNALVSGNNVSSNGITSANNGSFGIYVDGSNVTVSTNLVYDEGITGFQQKVGIAVTGSKSGVNVLNNVASGTNNDYNFGASITSSYYWDPMPHTNNYFGTPQASLALPGITGHVISFVIDGAGSAITTGALKDYPTAEYACTINKATISADQSGSITVDVWKAAGAIPTSSNKISASAPVTLSTSQLNQASAVSTWSPLTVSVGDVFGFSVASAATVTHVVGQLWCQ